MDMSELIRLKPTAEILAEELTLLGLDCATHISDPAVRYCNVRLFTGQQHLYPDVLYALRPGETRFPTDRFSYVCTTHIPGTANHISCPGHAAEQVLDALMELFFQFQQREMRLDQLLFRNGNLQELCELGSEFLENPVFIHDDWFIIIGMSHNALPLMHPDSDTTPRKVFVPKSYTESFKHDSDYTQTYSYPDAQLWRNPDGTPATLYVNLWDGTVFRGRLLVAQQIRPFRRADYLISEILTQRAMMILRGSRGTDSRSPYRSMDSIVRDLLEDRSVDASTLIHLLSTLRWQPEDRYLCIRLRRQQTAPDPVMEHLLHSDLFQFFPGSYILYSGREQCVVVNCNGNSLSYSQLNHLLAPLCRDYCLYAGISSPVNGIRELHLSYHQAQAALNQAFSLQSEKWIISFSDCTLEYIFGSMRSPLTPRHLVSPDLYALMDHDRENDTQYFKTLQTWLLMERNVPETSQALIIHRSTLLYRLKKIQSIIRSNLDDPWQRLTLQLSYWILENNPQRQ